MEGKVLESASAFLVGKSKLKLELVDLGHEILDLGPQLQYTSISKDSHALKCL